MPISVVCECGAKLNAPDTSAGKRVKCPKCAAVLTVPAPEDDFEMVDDEPAPPKKRPARVADDDEDDRPVKRRASRDDDDEDEDDRPVKRRSRRDEEEDEEEDDRPRPKKKKKGKKAAAKSNLPLILGIGGGVLMLALVGVILAVVFLSKDDKQISGPVASGTQKNQPNALQNNWVDVDKPEFAAKFLAEGNLREDSNPAPNGITMKMVGKEMSGGQGGQMVIVMNLPPAQAAQMANDPNKFLADALKMNPLTAGKANTLQPTTVGGQQAQGFVYEERGLTNHIRMLIANSRMYMLIVGGRGLTESDEKVKVFFDSFQPK
jgi:hypothetical protein